MFFCTKFDHHYLDKGLVLYESLRKHYPQAQVCVLALTEECSSFLQRLGLECVTIFSLDDLFSREPRLSAARQDRDLASFIFTLTPQVILAAMEFAIEGEQVVYIDADMMFFGSPAKILEESKASDVALAPHNFSPHMEGQKRFGIYNVGWVGFKKSSGGVRCAKWWAESCLEWCHDRLENGKFADQKYLENFESIADSVHVIKDIGLNAAPWNVSGRRFTKSGEEVQVDGTPLVLYHFAKVKRILPWCIATRAKQQAIMRAPGIIKNVYSLYTNQLEYITKKYQIPYNWIFGRVNSRHKKYNTYNNDLQLNMYAVFIRILKGEYVISLFWSWLKLFMIENWESESNTPQINEKPEKIAQEIPKISIITPCYNQGHWLLSSTKSILDQNYSNIEYVIMDGGSTDGSREIIQSIEERLHEWKSEKDDGQYSAINNGFLLTQGCVMGWLNGDDIHFPWTLSIVGEIFAALPQVRWLTTCYPIVVDTENRPRDCREARGFSRYGILKGETLAGSNGYVFSGIQQESTFWRRDLWEQAGGRLETEFDYAGDFDLWMRFAKHADIYSVTVPLAGFRRHGDQKTSRDMGRYRSQAMESFRRHGQGFSNRRLRTFACQFLPHQLKPLAAKLGWLYPAKIVKKNRDTGEWVVQEILG